MKRVAEEMGTKSGVDGVGGSVAKRRAQWSPASSARCIVFVSLQPRGLMRCEALSWTKEAPRRFGARE